VVQEVPRNHSPGGDVRPLPAVFAGRRGPAHDRGGELSHETVRFWWHRFGPMFASEIRKRRIEGMESSRWRWHLDAMFVKINGERHYRRAVDHDGEVLESFDTKTRDRKADGGGEAAGPGSLQNGAA